MKPNDTVRYACGDGQVVFDLSLAPALERAELLEEDDSGEAEPTCCPFCGAAELAALHDTPTRI